MILDTAVLVDLLRGDAAARAAVQRLEDEGEVLWVPAPAVFELWEGIERADRPDDERVGVERVVGEYTSLAFDVRHASRAGRISGQFVRRGTMVDPVDAQIAGCALEERLPVLTRNVKHFERVAELAVETY